VEESNKCVRELEEGCDIRIGKLRQMIDAMIVEKHTGLAPGGGRRRDNLENIHLISFFSRLYFYISKRVNFK